MTQTCFYVVGNGPSMSVNILRALPQGRWLGMNSAYRLWQEHGTFPKYYACLDPVVLRSHGKAIVDLLERPEIEHFFLHEAILDEAPHLSGHPKLTLRPDFVERSDLVVPLSRLAWYKQTTGVLATRFAIERGERRLLLLGIDCNYVERVDGSQEVSGLELTIADAAGPNPNYFFDGYQARGDRYQVPNPSTHSGNLHLQSFIALAADLQRSAAPVEIAVASPRSLLHQHGIFPLQDFWHSVGMRRVQCVAVPLIARELDTLLQNLALWLSPKLLPSLSMRRGGTCVHLFFDAAHDPAIVQRLQDFLDANPGFGDHFSALNVTFLDLPDAVNYYDKKPADAPRFCTKSGPNLMFLASMLQCADYDHVLQLETDCLPVRAGWLDAAENETLTQSSVESWVIGPAYFGETRIFNAYRAHINGNAIYRTGCREFQGFIAGEFVELLMQTISGGVNEMAYDTLMSFAAWNSDLLGPRVKALVGRTVARYRHSALIFNGGGAAEGRSTQAVRLKDALHDHPGTFLVHGPRLAEAVRRDFDALDSMFSSAPGQSRIELPFRHAWCDPKVGARLTHEGFGGFVADGLRMAQSQPLVLQFMREGASLRMPTTFVFEAVAQPRGIRITSLQLVRTRLGVAPQRLGEASLTVNPDGAGPVRCTATLGPADDALDGIGVLLDLAPLPTADDAPPRLQLTGMRMEQRRAPAMGAMHVTLQPPADAVAEMIRRWERFIETGAAQAEQRTPPLYHVDFDSDAYHLGQRTWDGRRLQLSLAPKGRTAPNRRSQARSLASVRFHGRPPALRAGGRFAYAVEPAAPGICLRIARAGRLPWEFAELPLAAAESARDGFFEHDHEGFNIELWCTHHHRAASVETPPIEITLDLNPEAGAQTATGARAPAAADAPLPRVLVLDMTPIGHGSATGQVKELFFGGWPADRLLQIWEVDRSKGLLAARQPSQSIDESRARLLDVDAALARGVEFDPELIYIRPVDSLPLLDLGDRLLSRLRCPVVVHIMDDWPERLRSQGDPRQPRYDRLLRRQIDAAAQRLSIGDSMSEAFAARYGGRWTPIANGVDVASAPVKDWRARRPPSRERPFVIRYLGGLAPDMNFQSVVDVARAVADLQHRVPLRFEIRTMPWYRETAEREVGSLPGVEILDLAAPEDYAQTLADADLLLLACNFDAQSIAYIRHSLANKIPECLASGVPVLAYGPPGVASIDYLDRAGCARMVHQREPALVRSALLDLAGNLNECERLGRLGREHAAAHLDASQVRQRFAGLLRAAALEGPRQPAKAAAATAVEPAVTILMPTLNQARFLEEAVRSALQPAPQPTELIVADGGSSDGTQQLLQRLRGEFGDRLRCLSEPDDGPAQALNRALRQARGRVIGWLNSDDLYTPGAVARALEHLDDHPDQVMVYGEAELIDTGGHPLGRYPTRPPTAPRSDFEHGCFICQPTVFLRRDVLSAAGGLDESLRAAFDFDLWLRLFEAHPGRIGFIAQTQARSRMHEATITSRRRADVALEAVAVLRRHLRPAPAHWLLTHLDELCAGHPFVEPGRDPASALAEVLRRADADLSESARVELRDRLATDRRLALATSHSFVAVHADGWAGTMLEVRLVQPETPWTTLRLHCRHASPDERALRIEVRGSGRREPPMRVDARGSFELMLRPASLQTGSRHRFSIVCGGGFVPAEIEPGSTDRRRLAFVVERCEALVEHGVSVSA